MEYRRLAQIARNAIKTLEGTGSYNRGDKEVLDAIGITRSEYDAVMDGFKDVVAAKIWSREDIAQELIEKGFSGNSANIDRVIKTGCASRLEGCSDSDWGIIDYGIYVAEGLQR